MSRHEKRHQLAKDFGATDVVTERGDAVWADKERHPVQGEIEIVDANIATGDLPVGLQHGNGVLTLTRDRVNI